MDTPKIEALTRQLNQSASKAVRAYGVRRSGQHAIINWILRNCGRNERVFLNNCRLGNSPVSTCAKFELDGSVRRGPRQLASALETMFGTGAQPFVLISYETGFPAARYAAGDITTYFANRDFSAEILISRSFVNWLPSFVRMIREIQSPHPHDGLDVLKNVMRGIDSYKAHLIEIAKNRHPHISFDAWYSKPDYRQKKLVELGLQERDNTRGPMQPYGGGSSFSEQNVSELGVLARWKTLRQDPFAQNILAMALADAPLMEVLAEVYPNDRAIIETVLSERT